MPATRQPAEKSSSNDATEIFFLGVGNAYHGIMHLLNSRGKCTLIVGKYTHESLFMAKFVGHLRRYRSSPDFRHY